MPNISASSVQVCCNQIIPQVKNIERWIFNKIWDVSMKLYFWYVQKVNVIANVRDLNFFVLYDIF